MSDAKIQVSETWAIDILSSTDSATSMHEAFYEMQQEISRSISFQNNCEVVTALLFKEDDKLYLANYDLIKGVLNTTNANARNVQQPLKQSCGYI